MTARVSFLFDGHGGEDTVARVQEALSSAAPETQPKAERFWHSLRVTLDVPVDPPTSLPKGTWWTTMYVATEPIDAAFDVLHRAMEGVGLEPRHVTSISAELATSDRAKLAPVIELRRPA